MVSESVSLAAELAEMEDDAISRALDAWSQFAGGPTPERVRVLRAPRHKGKSVVIGFDHVGPGGLGVVAKELPKDSALVELSIYRHVLPGLQLRGPDLIGCVDSVEPERAWLLLEAIEGPAYEKRDPGHIAIASRWLGAFHSGASNLGLGHVLSERGPEHYTSLAAATRNELDDISENSVLDASQLKVLRRLAYDLSVFVASSASFEDAYRSMPSGLVHGDFKGNNMAFTSKVGLGELRVFDWSEAHLGPQATDTWWVDPLEYRDAMEDGGSALSREEVDAWRCFGAVVRWIAAAAWEIPRLRYDWVDRPMRRMSLYEGRLRSALHCSPWLH